MDTNELTDSLNAHHRRIRRIETAFSKIDLIELATLVKHTNERFQEVSQRLDRIQAAFKEHQDNDQ